MLFPVFIYQFSESANDLNSSENNSIVCLGFFLVFFRAFKYPQNNISPPTEFDHAVHGVVKYRNVLVVASIQYIKRFPFSSLAKKPGLWNATELKIFEVNIFLTVFAFVHVALGWASCG